MKQLAKYLKYYKKEVIIGPILKFIEAVFELIIPLVMAKIIDIGIKNNDSAYIYKMGGVMILIGIVGLVCALICQYFASKASQGVGTRLRNDLFKHINSLSHNEIDKISTASLVNRMINDVNQIQVSVAMLIRLVVRAPFLVLGATIMAMILDLKMSLIFWICGILIALSLYYIIKKLVPLYRIIQQKLDKVSLITKQNLEGVRVIRAFSKQKYEADRFEKASKEYSNISVRVGRLSALLSPLTMAITNLGIIAIIALGGIQVNLGNLEQGQVIAFVDYMMQILLALVVVANLVIIFTKSTASAKRINEIFNIKSSIEEKNKEITINRCNCPKIEFKNVSFAYSDSNEYAIENISFKIMENEMIGIIGATGSGKSTIINLIPRFYECSKGEVLVNGINVKEYPFNILRKQIGVVSQKVSLFSGTILENLKLANEDAKFQVIDNSVKIAQMEDFINNLPDKYNTIIGQYGKNLSGGQKQRLTIARALVKEPQILILDDSLSALDFKTEKNLRKSLKKYISDMTIIIVAQRVNSIRYCDKIIVLDDGKIAKIGTHDELIKNCDIYKDICLSQNISVDEGKEE